MRTNRLIFYLKKLFISREHTAEAISGNIFLYSTVTQQWRIEPFEIDISRVHLNRHFIKNKKSESSAPPCHIFWQVPIAIHPRKKCRYFTRWQLCSMAVQNSATLALFGLKFCVIILCACWQVIWLSYRKAKMAAVLSFFFILTILFWVLFFYYSISLFQLNGIGLKLKLLLSAPTACVPKVKKGTE